MDAFRRERAAFCRGDRDGLSACERFRYRLCQSKIQKLHAGLGQHDVAGFQIAMHHAAAVRFVECVGDLHAVLQSLIERQGTLFKTLGEGFAFDAFHDEIGDAILMTDVMQHANMRMIQARNGFRFTLETLVANRIGGKLRGKNLDGDGTFEARIAGAIDFTHTAGTERPDNFIGAKMSAWSKGHNWVGL